MAGACLFLPTTAHVAAGGAVPTDIGLLLVAALLSVACVALADRRRRPVEIAGLLLLSQPTLHVILTIAGHHGPGAAHASAPMLIAHLLAAAVLSVLLSGAEAIVWSMASLSTTILLGRARRLLTSPRVPRTPRPPRRTTDLAAPYVVVLVRSTPWRGPPMPAGT